MRPKSRYDRVELRPAQAVDSFDDYDGVWVIVEQRNNHIQDVTLELLGAARPMAQKLGTQVTAVLLGHEIAGMAEALIQAGADRVIIAQHPILKTPLARPSTDVLVKLIQERKPEIVLIGATHTGRDVSSRVAVKIDAGMTADCTELDVDDLSGELLARRPAFGGKMLATIRCDRHRPQMATARPGIFVPLERAAGRKGEIEEVDVSWLGDRTYAADVVDHVVDEGKVDITKADVLVAVGLGVGGPEGIAKVQELADALGGKLAGTRPVCDKAWLPRTQQVGQTGLSVRPKLYVAVGISGAIQHIEGMKESGTVIAINNDPNAGIFQYADIGLVGDWKGIVDQFTAAARQKGLDSMKWMVPVKDSLAADRQAAQERAAKAAGKAEAKPAAKAGKADAGKADAGKADAGKADAGKADAGKADPPAKTDAEPAAPDAPPAADKKAPSKADAAAPAADQDVAPDAPAKPPAAAQEPPTVQATAPEAEPTNAEFTGDPTDTEAVRAWVKGHVPEEQKAWVLAADCIVCNGCEAACPTGAAIVTDMARVDRDICIADGACFDACPTDAIRPGIEDIDASGGWPEGSRLAGQFGIPE